MTTIVTDPNDEDLCIQLPVPPEWVPPSIRELLAREPEDDAWYYVCDGAPIELLADIDLASDFSTHPIKEVNFLHPLFNGKRITREEFETRVKAIHGLIEGEPWDSCLLLRDRLVRKVRSLCRLVRHRLRLALERPESAR
jgi:hypothetical protein